MNAIFKYNSFHNNRIGKLVIYLIRSTYESNIVIYQEAYFGKFPLASDSQNMLRYIVYLSQ